MALHTGIVANVHLSPATETRGQFLSDLARYLLVVNTTWIAAQLHAGKTPPQRLLFAGAPWAPRGVAYVRHHGPRARARERTYYDGATAMHVGEATCIELAAYDAAAMHVLEGRVALPAMIGRWPDVHFVIDEGKRSFDTSTPDGARASLTPEATWSRPQ